MAVKVEDIKELREQTSCGVIECKKALDESDGDLGKAKAVLQKRGLEIAAKKGSRTAKEGRIEAYIHLGAKVGVMVEVNCETDFVAQNDDFKQFTKDLAMHIVAVNPAYLKKEDVPQEILDEQKDKENFIKENCLLDQDFVKDSSKKVQDCVTSLVSSMGENIFISRFTRYKVNEG